MLAFLSDHMNQRQLAAFIMAAPLCIAVTLAACALIAVEVRREFTKGRR